MQQQLIQAFFLEQLSCLVGLLLTDCKNGPLPSQVVLTCSDGWLSFSPSLNCMVLESPPLTKFNLMYNTGPTRRIDAFHQVYVIIDPASDKPYRTR